MALCSKLIVKLLSEIIDHKLNYVNQMFYYSSSTFKYWQFFRDSNQFGIKNHSLCSSDLICAVIIKIDKIIDVFCWISTRFAKALLNAFQLKKKIT